MLTTPGAGPSEELQGPGQVPAAQIQACSVLSYAGPRIMQTRLTLHCSQARVHPEPQDRECSPGMLSYPRAAAGTPPQLVQGDR